MRANPRHTTYRADPSAQVRHVLVVEDNPVTADVIQFYLQRVGYQVRVAHDGYEALRCLDERRFDVVVTDYRLPQLNGRALCQQMRRRDCYRRVPVLMLTARSAELDLSELRRELELTDVLAKPFSPRALVRTIQACMAQKPN